MIRALVVVALVASLSGCSSADEDPPSEPTPGDLVGERRRRADALTSLFENDTPTIQYDYIENLGDGRGFTAGRAGFTSADGDLLAVAKLYSEAVPDNALTPFLPRLEALASSKSDDTSTLTGFEAAWRTSAADPKQRAAQDATVDKVYFEPALRFAGDVGLVSPLSKAILYDTIIQHGSSNDPDGLPALISRTKARAPSNGDGEADWITSFLAERRKTLEHADNADTRAVWAESVGRVDVLRQLVDDGEWLLDHPLEIDAAGYTASIP